MAQQIFQIKKEICEIGKRIWQKGFCAGNEGNHSVRISEDRVLCTPTGLSKGFLTPDMLCIVDMDGKQVDTNNKYKRTSEVLVHLAIYKQRDDINAVIHSHPPHATTFAIAGIPLPEGIHPEALDVGDVVVGQSRHIAMSTDRCRPSESQTPLLAFDLEADGPHPLPQPE